MRFLVSLELFFIQYRAGLTIAGIFAVTIVAVVILTLNYQFDSTVARTCQVGVVQGNVSGFSYKKSTAGWLVVRLENGLTISAPSPGRFEVGDTVNVIIGKNLFGKDKFVLSSSGCKQ